MNGLIDRVKRAASLTLELRTEVFAGRVFCLYLCAAGRAEHVDFCRVAAAARPGDEEPIELP